MSRHTKYEDSVGSGRGVPAKSTEAPEKLHLTLNGSEIRLGEGLIQNGLITIAELQQALTKKNTDGIFLGQALVELEFVDQQDLSLFLIKQCEVPHFNLLEYELKEDVVKMLPKEVCEEHSLLAIDRIGSMLTVAMVNPLDVQALDAVCECFPELQIKPILCDWDHYKTVFKKIFCPPTEEDIAARLFDIGKLNLPQKPRKKSARARRPASAEQPDTRNKNGPHKKPASSTTTEEKLDRLTDAMTSLAETSDFMKTAKEAEKKFTRNAAHEDLNRHVAEGSSGAVFPLSGTQQGSQASKFGAEHDSRVIAALEAGAPIQEFIFDSFLAGEDNARTCAIAQAVAEAPGDTANPFFVYGDVGVGKTHLVNAVGNHARALHPDLRVAYVCASRFASRWAEIQDMGSTQAFRETFCHWDMLILDDIQFLAGNIEIQEELFHIFNALQHQGRQIVVVADKPPARLGLLEQRLVSRFSSGLVSRLVSPDRNTRLALLDRWAHEQDVDYSQVVLERIADRIRDDVRTMKGIITKMTALTRIGEEPMTCDGVDELLTELGYGDAA